MQYDIMSQHGKTRPILETQLLVVLVELLCVASRPIISTNTTRKLLESIMISAVVNMQ
jgi:hypothetical protein